MLRKLLAVSTVLPLVIGWARAQDYDISPGQISQVDQTCREVLGLKRGEAWFAGCQESLSNTLITSQATSLTTSNEGRVMAADTQTQAGDSFYEVSPQVQWKRERHACARLGLLPGSSPFAACVSSLQGAFLQPLN